MPTSLVRSLRRRLAPRPQSHPNAKPMWPRRVSPAAKALQQWICRAAAWSSHLGWNVGSAQVP